MNELLSLFLAGAALVHSADDQTPKPRISVSAQVYTPDGKATGASRWVDLGPDPAVLYLYTGKTLCEARTVSTEKPVVAGNGWKVTLAPIAPTVGAGAKTTQVKATWQRMWEGGKDVSTTQLPKSRTITISAGNPIPLDSIDGGTRRAAHDLAAKLRAWGPYQPLPQELDNSAVVGLYQQIAVLKADIRTMQTQQALMDNHPKVLAATKQLRDLEEELLSKVTALADQLQRDSSAVKGLPAAVDGCTALSMNLQIDGAPVSDSPKVFELEFWLVHRDPAGKETTQRQVVRTGSMAAEFYFDDLKIETEKGPVTVEIYGGTGSVTQQDDKSVFFNMGVHRRYVTNAPGYNWKTKEGENAYGGSRGIGEVVAYVLPPMTGDDGALVGHRFSLRVRVKVLQ